VSEDVEPFAWAALRDATFLRCPQTRTVKRPRGLRQPDRLVLTVQPDAGHPHADTDRRGGLALRLRPAWLSGAMAEGFVVTTVELSAPHPSMCGRWIGATSFD
jgi:hypothetical protein